MATGVNRKNSQNRSPFRGWAVFAFVLTGWMNGCGIPNDLEDAPNNDALFQSDKPAQTVEDGYFEYTEHGKVLQALQASRLERWETEGQEEGIPSLWHVEDGFTLYIGGNKNRHSARLSARRGTYDDKASRLEAWEEVVLVNQKGERLLTEHLIWSHDSDLVHTNRPVEIETQQGVLRGRGLRADSQFERYEILAPTGSFDLGVQESDGKNP